MTASAVRDNVLFTRYYTAGTSLCRVLGTAPYYPRVSANKTAELSRPIEYAIRWPYMQINRRDHISWLVFDCDHGDLYRWEGAGLPPPNIIVASRKGGVINSYHVFYAISSVCTSPKARSHPIAYMKAIYAEMRHRLGADPDYNGGPVCKTPGHPWWHTIEIHGHEYSLGELQDYIEIPQERPPFSKGADLLAFQHSRKLTLFEKLRFYAYGIVKKARSDASYESFHARVSDYAKRINDYERRGFLDVKTGHIKGNLPLSEVKAVVKSVSRWTWDRYTGDGKCDRGVMGLPDEMPLRTKQQLAAARTHLSKTNKSMELVRSACATLKNRGERITQTAIAKLTTLCRQTVAKYLDLLANAKLEKTKAKYPNHSAPTVETRSLVNFAAHKISARHTATGTRPLIRDKLGNQFETSSDLDTS